MAVPCMHCKKGVSDIELDVVMWPGLIAESPVLLCANCYVELWVKGVQMGTRNAAGGVTIHGRLGRYEPTG